MTIGSQIAKRRNIQKWNQRQLGKKAGISQIEVSRIETGRTKRIPESLLRKFAEALQVPVSYFYEEEIPKIWHKYKILVALNEIHENTLAKFYHKGKEVILKSSKGKAEIKGKIIECTKSFGEEEK